MSWNQPIPTIMVADNNGDERCLSILELKGFQVLCSAHVENPIEFDLLDALIDRLLPGDRLPLASALIQ